MTRPPLILAAAALLAGCAISPTPNYDLRFGDAVRNARLAQTLNPQPSTNDVQGMDGAAAKNAGDRYQDSFKRPPPPVNVINIGGSIATGAAR
ncbi:hypothetical protein [Ramlibacter algicola]|uniref:Pilus assembly protein n=1 Tax=Ramlibacter algicola TaxID=2795217 RepID=A0A934Q2Y4_9BURK|nr:hypothetical protein [Ramlibacter algicola]MBK0394006.1 hypothetical protein [Ramlibacter algicola]